MITTGIHKFAVLDVETTGLSVVRNEIIQVAVVPLDSKTLEPDHTPFNLFMRVERPENVDPVAMSINGLSVEELEKYPNKQTAAEALNIWFQGIGLPFGAKLIPVCQNLPFDSAFTREWLGAYQYDQIFSRRGRDTMTLAAGINDSAAWRGLPIPFERIGLKDLCQHFKIELDGHHDALADCVATARLYRELIAFSL